MPSFTDAITTDTNRDTLSYSGIVSPVVASTVLQSEDFNGIADGTALTNANTDFTTVNVGTNTAVADGTTLHEGDAAARFDFANPGDDSLYVQWRGLGDIEEVMVDAVYRFDSVTEDISLHRIDASNGAAIVQGYVNGGVLEMKEAAANTDMVVATGTVQIPTGQFVRLQTYGNILTGEMRMRLWLDPDSDGDPDDEITYDQAIQTLPAIDRASVAFQNVASARTAGSMWIDRAVLYDGPNAA